MENKRKIELMFYAMARGMFLGAAHGEQMLNPIFPELNGDWVSASDDPEYVKKLAEYIADNQTTNKYEI